METPIIKAIMFSLFVPNTRDNNSSLELDCFVSTTRGASLGSMHEWEIPSSPSILCAECVEAPPGYAFAQHPTTVY
jgi:hypothetical protein